MTDLVIQHTIPASPGWAPIRNLIRIASEDLGAEVLDVSGRVTRLRKNIARLRGRRSCNGKPHALLIVKTAADISQAMLAPGWRDGYDRVAVWIIDSFWTEHCNKRDFGHHIDRVFVTRPNDVAFYENATGLPTTSLPWGSDVLGIGDIQASRNIDLLRVGRQPQIWEDDTQSMDACRSRNIVFHGRPPFGNNPSDIGGLMGKYSNAKIILASSNLASPASYVHKTKEYFTARWTDGVACGAIIAGQHPTSDETYSKGLWPDALLSIPLTSRYDGLDILSDALKRWTPDMAHYNHKMALARLDWRHRLAQIAEYFSLPATQLTQSLARIRKRLDA